MAERVIRSARHTLAAELRKGELIDFHQFGSVLAITAAIINTRHLSVRTTPDGDFQAISPRDVILGRANKSRKVLDADLESALEMEDDIRLQQVEDNSPGSSQPGEPSGWRRFLWTWCHDSKWRSAERNVQVDNIGHVQYEEKLGTHSWRIAKVIKVKPGADGLVRTITVSLRPRHVSDRLHGYKYKVPVEMELGVQRFAVLLPAEEQASIGQQVCGQSEEGEVPDASEMTEN